MKKEIGNKVLHIKTLPRCTSFQFAITSGVIASCGLVCYFSSTALLGFWLSFVFESFVEPFHKHPGDYRHGDKHICVWTAASQLANVTSCFLCGQVWTLSEEFFCCANSTITFLSSDQHVYFSILLSWVYSMYTVHSMNIFYMWRIPTCTEIQYTTRAHYV